MEQENKPNLIKKLISKFKSAKIVKKLASITLALGLAISVTACTNTQNQNNNNTNTGNGTNIENPNSPNENPYAQYSELLQYVLTSDYYNGLISQAKANKNLLTSAKFSNHPIAFLEDQGHNVDAILNGTISCITNAFVKEAEPNNLYMATYVENAGDYYTEYMLKYTLTDKEMRDYKLLYDMPDNNKNASCAYQAYFINDAVSKAKTPVIVSETKMSTIAHDYIADNKRIKNFLKANFAFEGFYGIILNKFDVTNNTFSIYLYPTTVSTNTSSNFKKLYTIDFISAFDITVNNNIYIKPYKPGEDALGIDKVSNQENIRLFIDGTNPTYISDLTDNSLIFDNSLNK